MLLLPVSKVSNPLMSLGKVTIAKKQIAGAIYRHVSIHFLEANLKKKALICPLVLGGTAFGFDISDGALFDG